jgi:CDGSH-type Zn-finger protein
MSQKPTIVVKKNGPYVVTDCQMLKGLADGTVYETSGTVALCRCGASSNKPFCDGTHVPSGSPTRRRRTICPTREKTTSVPR